MPKKVKLEDQSELDIYTQEEFETWQNQLNELQAKLTVLEAKAPETEAEKQTLQTKISSLETQILDLTQKTAEAVEANKQAQAELERLKAAPLSPPPANVGDPKVPEPKKRVWIA